MDKERKGERMRDVRLKRNETANEKQTNKQTNKLTFKMTKSIALRSPRINPKCLVFVHKQSTTEADIVSKVT